MDGRVGIEFTGACLTCQSLSGLEMLSEKGCSCYPEIMLFIWFEPSPSVVQYGYLRGNGSENMCTPDTSGLTGYRIALSYFGIWSNEFITIAQQQRKYKFRIFVSYFSTFFVLAISTNKKCFMASKNRIICSNLKVKMVLRSALYGRTSGDAWMTGTMQEHPKVMRKHTCADVLCCMQFCC